MLTITRKIIIMMMVLLVSNVNAQEVEKPVQSIELQERIDAYVERVKSEMKLEIEAVNLQLDAQEISEEEAKEKKNAIALKYAKRIQSGVAALSEQRSGSPGKKGEKGTNASIDLHLPFVKLKHNGDTIKIKRDRRTYTDIVLAFGFNNLIEEGKSLEDSQIKGGGSRFFELGLAWRTRVFKNSNWLRVKYGLSLQYNNFKPKGNQYFVTSGDTTSLAVFPHKLKKAKLRTTNLVVPVHFEFGPSKKKVGDGYVRYSTYNKFKIGLGGYAGLRIGTRQKLKYDLEGKGQKDKIKDDFNATDFVYGLSGYIGWRGAALYAKYDLNPLFESPNAKFHNVALGLRFDVD